MSSVLKIHRPRQSYTAVPNAMLRDKSLSMEARGFLAMLMSHADGFSVTREKMMEDAGFGRDKLERVSRELRDAGLLHIEPIRGAGGKIMGRRWIIGEHRTPENPGFGDHTPEKPAHGSTSTRLTSTHKKTNKREKTKEEESKGGDLFHSKKEGRKTKDEEVTEVLATVVSEESARDLVEHRKALKKPLSHVAAKRMAKKLATMTDPEAAIDEAIRKGWQDVYDKSGETTATPPSKGSDPNGRRYSSYELPGWS